MAFGYEEELRAEIERLRLTDAEREAIQAAARIIDAYDEEMDGFPSGAAATLRGLLSRTGDCPVPDNAADRDNGTTGSE